jgi:hypothetical protein
VLSNNECNIRKRIISYSAENATQKIWEVQGIPYLHKIKGLSEASFTCGLFFFIKILDDAIIIKSKIEGIVKPHL